MWIVNQTSKVTWQVAATFIGTIIGAGFASGQEILKFFSHYGLYGIVGIVLSSLLFCTTGTLIMLLGQKLEAKSFGDVIRHICGKHLGPVLDLLLSLFLFATLSVMLAGSGAVFFQQWGLSFWLGTGVTMIITVATVTFGLQGIIKANSIVVPFMILFCFLATVPSISFGRLSAVLNNFSPVAPGASPQWLLSSLLYVSYNITLGVSVLAPLGKEITGRKPLVWGGILGGIGLGVLALVIDLAILSYYPDSAQYEVPSLFIAGKFASIVQLAFSIVLWAEIFTTIIGNVYGLAIRISDYCGLNYRFATGLLMVGALVMSQIGFSGLVGTLYPLFGYVSLLFLASLIVFPFVKHR